jgi:hypothetical protein
MKRLVKITLIVGVLFGLTLMAVAQHQGPHSSFVHGIVIPVDGDDYYLAGAPDGPEGQIDVPGHYWVNLGDGKLQGKHFNTGPFAAEKWWSSDADDGVLLFDVESIIDTWSEVKAIYYISRGFTHYHELISVSDSQVHPSKVIWLKHIARGHFTFDGGPLPDLAHEVAPGLDLDFMVNALNPYDPADHN